MAQAYTYRQTVASTSTGTYVTLYNTGIATPTKQAVISSLVVCNTSGLPVTYRVALTDTETTPTTSQFLIYDQIIQANFTIALTLGIAMPNNKWLRVSSSAATLAFSAFISEIT